MKLFSAEIWKITACLFWADVMLRQPRIQASRASPAQKSRGLRVVLFQKLFQGYIFCFLGDSFGRCIFEQYARETNLKKKRSVRLSREKARRRSRPLPGSLLTWKFPSLPGFKGVTSFGRVKTGSHCPSGMLYKYNSGQIDRQQTSPKEGAKKGLLILSFDR